ncbi:phage baseplate plug family protein [Enterococcus wangshanyuanii]|uniref:Cyanophage baseplate Pam3 plug gp18 domain-containing protein n=1 Tax=Enterococcus wangshanyuanii TaxID=2005703 RepID=A0ABQ1PJ24_9ENTE|nr:hypothetical protein [Enterococcus wangshanyuanii]GGC97979.1 hypothetical protein GCM10011573_29400 [Enterococcus wangshanyuanii]
MSIRGYIPIEKDSLPEKFEIPLGNVNYILGIDYNKTENIFTVDLFSYDNDPIVIGEALVLDERLWRDIVDDRIPSIDLVPMDESGKSSEITFQNFGVDIFLYMDDLPPNYSEPSLEGSE